MELGIVRSTPRDRMQILARRKGFASIAQYAAWRYQVGTFATATALTSVMTRADLAAMQMMIGMHSSIGGCDTPYFPRLVA